MNSQPAFSSPPQPISTSRAQRREAQSQSNATGAGSEHFSSSPQEGNRDAILAALTGQAQSNEGAKGTTSSPSPQDYSMATKQLIDDARKARHKQELAAKRASSLPARRGLAPEIKARLIELFAHFQSVSRIQDIIKSEHGLVIDRRTIESFNPDGPRCRVGARLKRMFDMHRKAYVEAVAKQGIAHQAHRLKLIGDIVEKANHSKDFASALRGLELAAKEVGALNSAMTVKHEGTVAHVHASLEDAKAELAMRLAAVVEKHSDDLSAVATTLDTVATPLVEGP